MPKSQTGRERGNALLKRTGYATIGEVKKVARTEADRAVRAHEKHDHKGAAPTKLPKFADGGAPRARSDAGKAKHGKGKTQVNVIVAPQGGDKPAAPPLAPPAAPPRPVAPPAPPPGAGPGLPPPGAARPPMPPGPPPGAPMRARGGKVVTKAGAGGGEGRIAKAKAEAKSTKRR